MFLELLLLWAGPAGCPGCPAVSLPPPRPAQIERAKKPGLPLAGIHRKIEWRHTASRGWSNSPDGEVVWRMIIRSRGAAGVRAHITGLPGGNGRVWVYDANVPAARKFGPYPRDGQRDFWSDLVDSEAMVVEYRPEGSRRELPFQIPEISHLFAAPVGP